MPRYTHEMGDLAAQLDKKIAEMRAVKTEVQAHIKSNINPIENSEALRQVTASLAHMLQARRAMDDSCCGMICPIDYI